MACAAFALWTLCAHAVVLAGGNLFHLLACGVLAAGGLSAVCVRRRPPPSEPEEAALLPATFPGSVRLVGAVLGVAVLFAYARSENTSQLWWGVAAVLGIAAVVLALRPAGPKPRPAPGGEPILWLLAFVCGVLALAAHRYAIDDTFYIGAAVSVADAPSKPLFGADPLLTIGNLPLHNPIQALHSYELFNGALSYLTGISAIHCYHWISASAAAMMIPLAYARLLRVVAPTAWPAAVLATVVFLIADGDSHRSFGNYAFVRIWQGKAIMLHVFLPLISAYALEFAGRPTAPIDFDTPSDASGRSRSQKLSLDWTQLPNHNAHREGSARER